MLQIAVQGTSDPESVGSRHVVAHFPQPIDAMLQNVRRSPLIALVEGRDYRVLFLAKPRVSELDVILVLALAKADVCEVRVRLAS